MDRYENFNWVWIVCVTVLSLFYSMYTFGGEYPFQITAFFSKVNLSSTPSYPFHSTSNSSSPSLSQTSSSTPSPACPIIPLSLSEIASPVGTWIHRGPLISKSDRPCCSWDKRRHLASSGFQPVCAPIVTTVHAGWNGSAYGARGLLVSSGGNSCGCSPERMRAIAEYEWEEPNNTLRPWNSHSFCAALGNRSLIMMGDSTMGQLASALHNFVVVGGGKCVSQLEMVLSDTLTGRAYGAYNRGPTLLDVLRTRAPDVLLVGAGPHLFGVGDFADVVTYVAATFQVERLPRAHLIWRTSLGAGCTPQGVPLVPMMPPWASFWANRSCGFYNDYNYPLMQSWDEDAISFWKNKGNTSVLDLRPLWMRFDSRISSGSSALSNCVHVCVPGPLRLVGRLLTRILESAQEGK